MTMTSLTTAGTETDWLIARLLSDPRFQHLTYTATKRMVDMFRAEMAKPASARTVSEVAEALAAQTGSTDHDRYYLALSGYPEMVVALIPTVMRSENWSPCVSTICFVGNQVTFGVEKIIERGECLLEKYALPQTILPEISPQFVTAIREMVHALDATPFETAATVPMISVIDAYEAFQHDQMDTDGGMTHLRRT